MTFGVEYKESLNLVKTYGSLENAFNEFVGKIQVDQEVMNFLEKRGMLRIEEYYESYLKEAKLLDGKLRGVNLFKYATIALALVSAGITVVALLKNDEADLPPVPKYMVDSREGKDGKRKTINYLAAGSNGLTAFKESKKNKGAFADTKAYEGSQWLTVYQTKDDSAGKPITPDFVVQSSKEAPSGYDVPLHIIGEKGASNLISAEYMNYSKYEKLRNKNNSVYVFFKASEDQGTASAFSGGMIAIIAIAGVAVIALIAAMVRRSKKNSISE